jgi:hypothetical protein
MCVSHSIKSRCLKHYSVYSYDIESNNENINFKIKGMDCSVIFHNIM